MAQRAATVPEEFVSQVRDALIYLYDYAHLVRHPLAQRLATDEGDLGLGHALRNLILDAIEELRPNDSVPRGTRGWRAYDILTQRYVDGFVVDDILQSLHISLRQFQREQRRALLAVASILWRYRVLSDDGLGVGESMVEAARLAIEVERMGVRLGVLDVKALIADALTPVRPLAHQKRAEIVVSELPGLSVLVDRDLARQVLVAAVSAPIAASAHRVQIAWQRQPDGVVVSLDADVPVRERAALRQRLQEIGDLMAGQGGSLAITDRSGVPWRLELHLRSAGGTPILIVDDDQVLRQLFTRYLESEGYRSCGASSAHEALCFLEGAAPDAIIMDVMMRDMDGWQLLQLLRSRESLAHIPIIVCSVLNEPDLAQALGAQLFLRKPVGRQALLSAVRQVLTTSPPVE